MEETIDLTPRNIPILFNEIDMSTQVQFNNATNGTLTTLPDECPFCHNKTTPLPIGAHTVKGNIGRVVFLCPAEKCKEVFIGYYQLSVVNHNPNFNTGILTGTSIGQSKRKDFHKSISEISPDFVDIYNQSFNAEQLNLLQICGVGYRKSLEFLIKDFAIKNKPTETEAIKKALLGDVIKKHIDDAKIKDVASRAIWLGNDETHYVRKWETKDLSDLKLIIDLALVMIQSDSDFKELLKSMPEPVK